MNDDGLFAALAMVAVSVGALHSLAPDHWAPFAAVGRARGWSAGRTARVTLVCGFGHGTVSVLLGLLGLLLGVRLLQHVGERLEGVAGVLLIGFGLAYAAWGVRHAAGRRLHGHAHTHYDHVHDPSRATVGSLFLLFCADPCVAVIPLLFAAAPLGPLRTFAVILLYEAAMLATMLALVLPARLATGLVRARWLDRYADAAAGVSIAVLGVAVVALGV